MVDATKFQFHDPSVPKAYDEFLVPRLFSPWAELLVQAADLRVGDSVLDIASGPGTVARLAAARLGAGGSVVGTDIAAPMLEIARAKPAMPGAAPIAYVESPAAPLAVESGSVDRVLCQQGLQFFPDRLAAVKEMRRVLKPGGVAAIAVWCEIERNAIYLVYRDALQEAVGAEAAELMRAPFSWPDGMALVDMMTAAGFVGARVSTATLPMTFELGVDQAVAAFAGTPVSPRVKALPADRQLQFRAALERRFQRLLRDGAVVGAMTSNIAVGVASLAPV